MNITFAGLTLGALALCGVCLVSCVVSPQRPAAQYRVPPQGPHEHAVAQAFDALVRAFGRQDADDVMDVPPADDAQIESAAPEAAGPLASTPQGSSRSASMLRPSGRSSPIWWATRWRMSH